MALSLAIIVLAGVVAHRLFAFLRLPGFLGVLFLGMLLGPYGLNHIDETIMLISPDLRKIALVIILLRAGLGLHRQTLKMVGSSALKLGIIPVIFEGFMVMLAAIWLLGFSTVEAGMLGFIVAAVSPAVIVPKMLYYIETGRGTAKGIPTMILAGASIDDVIAITIFSGFAGYFAGSQISLAGQIFMVPLSVITGVFLGLLLGLLLLKVFRHFKMRHTKKLLLVLSFSILLASMEDLLYGIVPVASLLGVMVLGFMLYERRPQLAMELSQRFTRIWVFAEILLFFLVGAEVNVLLALESGAMGLLIIAAGLLARSAGVMLSLQGSNLSVTEKGFCVMAYSPKATVQAAIGSVPLMMGAPYGDVILAIAVLSIVVTAPVGATAMNILGEKFLKKGNV